MNIRQVEVFKAIMDTGSVTEAAGRLNVTQPSVSKHLKLLEFDLGLSLFARTGNKLMPTPEATALYDQVDRLYRGLDQLNRFSDGLKHHQHGQITVGAMPLIAQRWLPQIVGTFLDTPRQGVVLAAGQKLAMDLRVGRRLQGRYRHRAVAQGRCRGSP